MAHDEPPAEPAHQPGQPPPDEPAHLRYRWVPLDAKGTLHVLEELVDNSVVGVWLARVGIQFAEREERAPRLVTCYGCRDTGYVTGVGTKHGIRYVTGEPCFDCARGAAIARGILKEHERREERREERKKGNPRNASLKPFDPAKAPRDYQDTEPPF